MTNRPLGKEGKPRLLDLFCGAGGCTKGYQRAGFYVVGVDIKPQPNYCGDEFVQADALDFTYEELTANWLEGFDAIHASPPCQRYTHARLLGHRGRDDHPDLIAPTRRLLKATGLPYVIENVVGAPLDAPIELCGSAFGLEVERHRLFECSFPVMSPGCAHGARGPARFPGTPRHDGSRPLSRIVNPMASACAHEDFAAAVGIDWMPKRGFRPTEELQEAIPPAYTEHVGHYLMLEVQARTKAAA